MKTLEKWFECKVKYDKVLEDGCSKNVTDTYLIRAISFAEAEARAVEEVAPYITGEFEVCACAKRNYQELIGSNNGERFYKVKVSFITLDEKTAKEKVTSNNILVQADDISSALSKFEMSMKMCSVDYVVDSVADTKYVDVITNTNSMKAAKVKSAACKHKDGDDVENDVNVDNRDFEVDSESTSAQKQVTTDGESNVRKKKPS